ncbi:MAG TPA: outer membrane beta-barrel protein [Bradyrhizobium sp.]|nr:outer membrane beta-barrel protein [Bradyrhizobium sp.]
MKRSVLAGLGLLALAVAPASAADLPRQMPYKAPAYVTSYNWTGFYIGAHAGYGWGNSDGLDLRGGFIGGQIGYNWQGMGNPWVFGIEVDSAWADFGRSDTFGTPAGLVSVSSNANYQGSARGRIGYAFDRTMVYVTGGVGWINNEVSINATVAPFVIGAVDSQMHVGGVVGAGVEHAFAPNWSGKVEYLYSAYGRETYFNTFGGGFSADADTHTVKVGLNYHFR